MFTCTVVEELCVGAITVHGSVLGTVENQVISRELTTCMNIILTLR